MYFLHFLQKSYDLIRDVAATTVLLPGVAVRSVRRRGETNPNHDGWAAAGQLLVPVRHCLVQPDAGPFHFHHRPAVQAEVSRQWHLVEQGTGKHFGTSLLVYRYLLVYLFTCLLTCSLVEYSLMAQVGPLRKPFVPGCVRLRRLGSRCC